MAKYIYVVLLLLTGVIGFMWGGSLEPGPFTANAALGYLAIGFLSHVLFPKEWGGASVGFGVVLGFGVIVGSVYPELAELSLIRGVFWALFGVAIVFMFAAMSYTSALLLGIIRISRATEEVPA